jgi:Ca-activated chloride channel family protein
MKPPMLKLIPLRNAVSSDASTSLDLLVRIIPPAPETNLKRPQLNLGLVIDRSGSMAGQKMEYARQAAKFAVQQLLPTDRVSVTIYDHEVEVLVPSTIAENKAQILSQIQSIEARGSTALHDGWLEGGVQVSQHFQPTQLNRILLLSDGLANIGATNPDRIASDVHGLAQNGVSTSTMGIGDDYNEDLMQAMANSGDGNYYYIASPQQLPEIFAAELQGIMATLGSQVSLGIEPLADVTVTEVYNNLTQTEYGHYQLPNLIVGNNIDLVLRLQVPPISKEKPLCQFRLAWNSPDQPGRQELRETLQLPVMAATHRNQLPVNSEVNQLITQLKSARAKEEMIQKLDAGDYQAAKSSLAAARQQVMSAPPSPEMAEELESLAELELDLEAEDYKKLRKRAAYDAYRTHQSRSPNRKTK